MSKPPAREQLKIIAEDEAGLHLDGGVGGVVHHSWGESIEAEEVQVIKSIAKDKREMGEGFSPYKICDSSRAPWLLHNIGLDDVLLVSISLNPYQAQ